MTASLTAADLVGVVWKGDDKAAEFLQDWLAIDSRIEAGAMNTESRMNMFWAQVRQSEKAAFALHKWSDKEEEDRTYGELLALYKKWLADRKSQENFMKIVKAKSITNNPPSINPVVDESTKQKKDRRKPRDRKKDKGKEVEDNVAAFQSPKGGGKGKDKGKPKMKCLHFQKKYGAKGCERNPCGYAHVLCDSREEYDELKKRVENRTPTNSSGSESGGKTDGKLSKSKEFRKKFCRWGTDCKFQGDADKPCKMDHSTYPTFEKWKAALKAATDSGSSSDSQ